VEALLIANRRRPLDRAALPSELAVVEASSGRQALEEAHRAVARGVSRVLVAGGDGSVQTVLPALAGGRAVLGILPRGTGNDLAFSLGLPGDLGAALEIALNGEARPLDLLELEGAASRGLAAVGVAAGAAVRVQGRLDAWRRQSPRTTRRLGRAGFVATALAEAVGPESLEARVDWDGGSWRGPLMGMMLFLRDRFGGGFPAPPGRRGEGRFQGVILRDPGGAAGRLALVAALRSGRVDRDGVALFQGSRVEVRAGRPVPLILDGEYRRRRDPALRVRPGALLAACR
jgi:diacylglycerol kinase family enzyme